jgi:hypothetical protein
MRRRNGVTAVLSAVLKCFQLLQAWPSEAKSTRCSAQEAETGAVKLSPRL